MRLTQISSRAYEHPADRSALVALRKLTGFDTLLKLLNGLFNERAMRLTFLASSVRVSERQFPHIHEMLRDGAYILDMDKVPELFVTQDPTVNAMALGTNTPFIVLNTAVVAPIPNASESTTTNVNPGDLGRMRSAYRRERNIAESHFIVNELRARFVQPKIRRSRRRSM